MSCVMLYILKSQALAELLTIPCLSAVLKREQSPVVSGAPGSWVRFHIICCLVRRAVGDTADKP